MTALRRLLAARRPPLALAGALSLAALLPAEGTAGAALRAGALLGALAAAASALRVPPPARALALAERQPLGRDSGVAVVEADGRRLLLGYAPSGVSLLLDLSGGSPR